jgi:hypothetical protein
MSQPIFTGNTELKFDNEQVHGQYLNIDGEKFYKISRYDKMQPFFMSVVSADDHWMYISSNGALSAGRINRDNALFPYYTDDKIHDSAEITGSKTILFVERDSKQFLWEVFSERYAGLYRIERNLYKNVPGNILIFEEINKDLNISFRYSWQSSEKYGFVRRASLHNLSDTALGIKLLDGIQNIMPYGIDSDFQGSMSTLADAYKKNELLPDEGIGIYYLNSVPTDKAEPAEGLKASVVWSHGLDNSQYLLSSGQLDAFRKGMNVSQETEIRAARGAYFLQSDFNLAANEIQSWHIVADINMDLSDLTDIRLLIKNKANPAALVEADVKAGTQKLRKIVATADGLQLSSDELSCSRHFSNVLFNTMRGGVITSEQGIDTEDFKLFLKQSNYKLYKSARESLQKLAASPHYRELIAWADKTENPDLMRLSREYLPLTFSRRHGDPSRPWNYFSIHLKNEDGSQKYYYEGNWRDIFQNWEALAISFPEYIESMVAKFVNASSPDGYNPYRISTKGIDWEVTEPDNPWSNIGYWGDHQIVYLHKLLEISQKYNPKRLRALLSKEIFAYADVPYRIKTYSEICRNPYDTITFDTEAEKEIQKKYREIGSDAKLVSQAKGEVFRVNLVEKLLLTAVTKLSNFIPEAGIWLNTQRPEWNDANNALVGNGASMVTLYYLRPYLLFLRDLLKCSSLNSFMLTEELKQFLYAVYMIFEKHEKILDDRINDTKRKEITDALGQAGSKYRQSIYEGFSGRKSEVPSVTVRDFINRSLRYIEHSIEANKRPDNLYHAYNLIQFDFDKNKLEIDYLYEMLEGQVAVLSSGYLSPSESSRLLDALKNSAMYRSDQYSYTLYPDKNLSLFTEKNIIPKKFAEKSNLFQELLAKQNSELILKDAEGNYHFEGEIRNAQDLNKRLDNIQQNKALTKIVESERRQVLDIWESMFNHRSFTGRSGTFFGYEGLGSIYWHMVSKLLSAVGESYYTAVEQNASGEILGKLTEHYYEIRAGIGVNKAPDLYGAFPTDPYSHTPAHAGAQQPGMTGQVKEDIISRFRELGVFVKDACLSFNPILLRKSEFLSEEKTFNYIPAGEKEASIQLPKNALAFTFCQIPVIYRLSDKAYIMVKFKNGKTETIEALSLNTELSRSVFARDKTIERLDVFVNPVLD